MWNLLLFKYVLNLSDFNILHNWVSANQAFTIKNLL